MHSIPDILIESVSRLPMGARHRLLSNQLWLLRELKRNPDSQYSFESFLRMRAIFFHIPKSAGLSVSQALFGNRGAGHISVTTAKLIFGRKNFNEFYKFCFVRNPWDRLVSAYYYLKAGGVDRVMTPWINEHINRFDSFGEFVRHSLANPAVMADQHLRPQYKFVVDGSGELKMDFVGRFESLQEDFLRISEHLGLSAQLPHINPSKRTDFRANFDDETAQIVARVYAEDIRLFHYSFDDAGQ